MTPAEFRALLDKATQVPWEEDDLFDFHPEDARAIVVTMNRAELFAELWEAAQAFADRGEQSFTWKPGIDDEMRTTRAWQRVLDVLAKLEES